MGLGVGGREKCLRNSENTSSGEYVLGHLEDKRPLYDSTSMHPSFVDISWEVFASTLSAIYFSIHVGLTDLTLTRRKRCAASRMPTVHYDLRPDSSVASACSNPCPGYTRLDRST